METLIQAPSTVNSVCAERRDKSARPRVDGGWGCQPPAHYTFVALSARRRARMMVGMKRFVP